MNIDGVYFYPFFIEGFQIDNIFILKTIGDLVFCLRKKIKVFQWKIVFLFTYI